MTSEVLEGRMLPLADVQAEARAATIATVRALMGLLIFLATLVVAWQVGHAVGAAAGIWLQG